jgi:putative addiction module killer protein
LEAKPREILRCHTENDRIPIEEWMSTLDIRTRARVRARIDRLEDGLFGEVKPVGKGVSELILDFDSGYRVYFAQAGLVVHLLGGGSKNGQQKDIDAAIELWSTHE